MPKDTGKRRVVVTGMGVVSPVGIGKEPFWQNLVAGKSGISDVERFDTSGFSAHRAGEVKDFTPSFFMPDGVWKAVGRTSQLAIASSKLALKDARLDKEYLSSRRAGAIFGTTMGEIPSLELIDKYWVSKSEDDIYISNVMKFPADNISNNVARFFGLKGSVCMIPTACAAGNYSIGCAFDLIRTGRADLMFAGGADSLSRIAYTGFSRLFAMAPEKCQPFDANRKGMILGEGAGVLLLEELGSAMKRGAKIYCEILGYGLSCDAHHMTAPHVEGVMKVMEKAMKNSGIGKEDVDYISAHGTGTPMNDKTECEAIKKVFGEVSRKLCVSSIKSMLGHTMGAASAIEAITCALAIENGVIPPTINLETQDLECDIDCVPNVSRRRGVRVALNNSFAFGGNNACVVLTKCIR
jgi:3-oxoacyl-[acyl-carrier-protein] synthase II